MKQIVILACFLTIQVVNAQSNIQFKFFNADQSELIDTQPIISKVFYQSTYVPDTQKRDSTVSELFELDYGKTASLFTSYTKRQGDSALQKMMKEQMIKYIGANGQLNTSPGNIHFDLPSNIKDFASATADQYYTSISNNAVVLTIKSIMGTVFLIKDTASVIKWKILDSTKDIQGNLCQKAVGESHGRKYTAWFCSDIPYSFGPRKLHGLPGLILEAYDDKDEIKYTLKNIQSGNVLNENIGIPKSGISATENEFDKAKTASEKNPEAFMGTHAMGETPPNAKVITKVIKMDGNGNAIQSKIDKIKSKTTANPIDLK